MSQKLDTGVAKGIVYIKHDDDGKIIQINLCAPELFEIEYVDKKDEAGEWADWFRKHSQKMHENPGNFTLSMEMSKRRAGIFQQTVRTVESGKYYSVNNVCVAIPDPSPMVESTIFYYREIHPAKKQYSGTMEVLVQNIDCVSAGDQLKREGFGPAILNMAGGHNPGGGVIRGAGAQEENLFRRSNLFKSLYQFADYAPRYGIKKSKYQYPLNFHFGGIYTPDAFFFRGSEKDGYPFLDDPAILSVISVPAINISTHKLSEKEYTLTTKDKIRTILRIVIENGHDSLVLSAFGCGAFRNDPHVMANLFMEVFHEPEFMNRFRRIVFAVIDDHNAKGNYAAFNKIINCGNS